MRGRNIGRAHEASFVSRGAPLIYRSWRSTSGDDLSLASVLSFMRRYSSRPIAGPRLLEEYGATQTTVTASRQAATMGAAGRGRAVMPLLAATHAMKNKQ